MQIVTNTSMLLLHSLTAMLSIKQTWNKEKEAEYGALIKQDVNMLKIVTKCTKKIAFYQTNFECKILTAIFLFIWNEIGVFVSVQGAECGMGND